MKVVITFWLMFVLSFLFLGFRDDKTAYENILPIEKLSPAQDLWARRTINIYKEHYHNYFLFSKDVIPARTLIHDLCQYFIIIALAYMLWERANMAESMAAITFLSLTSLDFVDYFLTHNGTYFTIGRIPVTFNTFAMVTDSLITLHIYFKYGRKSNN